jgi:threonine dehydrogenase-like Zn-dependent dehydrogenase
MRALVLGDDGPRVVEDWPEPRPAAGEALVEVRLAGVCGTDLELCAGYKGGFRGVLGHEFVGEVIEAADRAWVGRRVTASINLGCGVCPECREHGPEHCPARRVIGILGRDGVFAERVALPLANLHLVPDDLADEEAVFAEPLAAALHVLDLHPAGRVAVIGPGRLGLLAAQVLAPVAAVTVLGRRPESLEPARRLGLDAGLVDEAESDSFDQAVEASGAPAGLAAALRLVRPRGVVVLKSTYAAGAALDFSPAVVKELVLHGSRCGRIADAIEALAARRVRVRELVSGEFALHDGLAALAAAGAPGALKVLLRA